METLPIAVVFVSLVSLFHFVFDFEVGPSKMKFVR